MSGSKVVRQKTAIEKEFENMPDCLFDPLKLAYCDHPLYPPPKERCESCIIENVVSSLEDKVASETMRWFIAYRNFTKK